MEVLDAVINELAANGISADADGSLDNNQAPRTAWITDPDGRRIELVQWPHGHADGITAADWPDDS